MKQLSTSDNNQLIALEELTIGEILPTDWKDSSLPFWRVGFFTILLLLCDKTAGYYISFYKNQPYSHGRFAVFNAQEPFNLAFYCVIVSKIIEAYDMDSK